ncbi:MAG: DUF4369 domain-containing protein [Runella slithyformis]|nr:MAG: DUF4369 domain-containing protein [Runella slithyformis]TAE94277.1 MAG: DUF4369 domain-containing protein [Runella slithyformis]TAF28627.1 MAG: DUF4369 domain-containing protein [Runella slithyformis]TAF46635.1 MAG: DUF4369 domain-containing protein [Runella slithyformis]TAF82343.1 MAG: DUF4369 domain-containing protein [Runella slithyformis]
MRKIIQAVLLLFIVGQAAAQNTTYSIKGRIDKTAPGGYFLAHYFGHSQFIIKDTAQAAADGKLLFEGKNVLPNGLYLVLNPKKQKMVELVIDKSQQFSFETDTTDLIGNMKITGSRENELFYLYQKQVKRQADEIKLLQMQAKVRNDNVGQQILQNKIGGIRNEMNTYYQSFVKENAGSLTAKLLKASHEIELPAPPKRPDGRPDSAWLFRYYRAHFWDNFDFSEEALVRTPFLQRKLDRYMENLTYPVADSLMAAADFTIGKTLAANNREMKAYCIWYLTSKYENPEIVGIEATFVHLAEKYYLTGVMPVTDSSTIKNIRERVTTLKPLLAGKTMPALALTDTAGVLRSLADIKASYTIVVFYDPDCGHCRESTPVLKAFYEKNKTSRNVQIFAASVTRSPDQWKKYIREFGIADWIHGYDLSFTIDFRRNFDVITTPAIYVLDKNKTILARRMPADQLDGFLDFHEARTRAMSQSKPSSAKLK